MLVLSFDGDRLVAACGVAPGTAIAKPVRTAQLVITAGGTVDRAAVESVRDDLARLTGILRTVARQARS